MTKPFLTAILVATALLAIAASGPAAAGLSPTEQALWGAAAQAPLVFSVPSDQSAAVISKALDIIAHWRTYDRYMYAMNIKTVNDKLVKTFDPNGIGTVGFTITRVDYISGNEIQGYSFSIEPMHYKGNLLGSADQAKDAQKRAHLLAYLLETYVASLSPAPPAPTPPAVTVPPAPSPTLSPAPVVVPATVQPQEQDLRPYVDLIKEQIAAGNYDEALKSIDALRAAVAERQKGSAAH